MGYHDTITPAVIARNVFENPGWYTPYTPYQAEIAQGRLESLLNFQTMVRDLTSMDVANASLLDEATAAAEAMALMLRVSKRPGAATFLVSDRDVSPGHGRHRWRARSPWASRCAWSMDVVGRNSARMCSACTCSRRMTRERSVTCGALIERAHAAGALVAVGTDLLALTLMTPPGEAGADVVVGNAQRFGVPLGYGGPHAAFFAVREAFVRQAPGRIIGVSVDTQEAPRVPHGAADARAAHPAREGDVEYLHGAGAARQHGGVLRGVSRPGRPQGDRRARARADGAAGQRRWQTSAGGRPTRPTSTRCGWKAEAAVVARVRTATEKRGINLRYPAAGVVQVSLNETVTDADLHDLAAAFGEAAGATGT